MIPLARRPHLVSLFRVWRVLNILGFGWGLFGRSRSGSVLTSWVSVAGGQWLAFTYRMLGSPDIGVHWWWWLAGISMVVGVILWARFLWLECAGVWFQQGRRWNRPTVRWVVPLLGVMLVCVVASYWDVFTRVTFQEWSYVIWPTVPAYVWLFGSCSSGVLARYVEEHVGDRERA